MIKVLLMRKKQRERAIELASSYVNRLEKSLHNIDNTSILAAVLYGSYGRGDFHRGSDIDLLLIIDPLPTHPLRRLDLLYECVKGRIEPKAYTKKEFLTLINSHNPIALDALTHGIVLLDRGFWGKAQGKLKNKVSGVRY